MRFGRLVCPRFEQLSAQKEVRVGVGQAKTQHILVCAHSLLASVHLVVAQRKLGRYVPSCGFIFGRGSRISLFKVVGGIEIFAKCQVFFTLLDVGIGTARCGDEGYNHQKGVYVD